VTIEQDKDAMAAEYVLGTLGPEERAEAQGLIAFDAAFAESVRRWERRLGELSAMVDPVEPPPDMWDRIKAAVGERSTQPETPAAPPSPDPPRIPERATASEAPVVAAPVPANDTKPVASQAAVAPPITLTPAAMPPSPSRLQADRRALAARRSARGWGAATFFTGALAACLAALVALQIIHPDLLPGPLRPKAKTVEVVRTVEVPSPKPAEFVAVLQKDAASPAFLLTFDLEKRMLTVRSVGAERQAGKSYELWLVSDKYPGPRSLGLIGATPYTVRPAEPEYDPVVINRATYAVSLEPEGGSPTGSPTGPVLYSGRLLQATAPEFPARTP